MKWFLGVMVVLLAVARVQAQAPDDQYVAVYNLIQDADVLNASGDQRRALGKYLEAQAALEKFRKGYPEWNPKVVNFRLTYVAAKIAALRAVLPPETGDTNGVTKLSATAALSARASARNTPPPDWQDQVSHLNGQVQQLQSDKSALESKLKEALSVQPAAVDSKELAQAQEKIRGLSKENDLLKLSLAQQTPAPAAAPTPAELEKSRLALEQAKADLAEQTKRANALEQERNYFQSKLNSLSPSSYNSNAIDATKKTVQAMDRKLSEQTQLAAKMTEERNALQARVKTLTADADAAAALRAENQVLKKQLADLKSLPPANAKTDDVRRQLALARTQLASLQSDRDMLRLEKAALEQRVKQMTLAADQSKQMQQIKQLQQERDGLQKQLEATKFELNGRRGELAMAKDVAADRQKALVRDADTIAKLQKERDSLRTQLDEAKKELSVKQAKATTTGTAVAAAQGPRPEDVGRINKLEQERDDLRKQLDDANKELTATRKSKASAAHVVEVENQIAGLQAKLEVFEAKKVPYTPEELALFRKPDAKLAAVDPKATPAPPKEMSQASVALVADAQRYFSAKQYDKAEERYEQVVQQNEANGATLANLAATELELNHLDKAESAIKQALATAPNDAYNLTVLGRLKYRQGKYDEALDALGRAAIADPQNAEIENYLGLTLGQKGMRGPAEAALRKAIQIEPSYGEAHNNLAVIYVTQQPPLVELARWHYQKALDSGSPHNPDLEKMLEAKKPSDATQ
jgi:Flp pilus assembly protein TadD